MKHTLGLLTALLLSSQAMLWAAESGTPPVSAGLTKGPNATVLRDGKPYRGIGVNYFDCFLRTLNNGEDTSYEAGFATLAAKGIPFARFCATGFWPRDMKLYQTDRAEYFRRLDGVVKSAEKNGIGLVPSLFWYHACVPDLVGEPMDQWGNPQSKTHAWMREYVREIVTRYRDHPTIWAWELGNEFSLSASLPNAKDHRPKVHADLGTPATRSERDDLTYAMLRVAFAEFGKAVREHDAGRLILSGDSFPRPSAWHQENENKWTTDTPEQFAEILTLANPDPISAISLHAYDSDDQRFATAMEVSRKLDKPLFIGEFGAPDETPEQAEKFRSLLKAIVDHDVPLAALWVFDLKTQKEWSVTAHNARAWQLDLISEANKRRSNSHPLVTRHSGDLPIILSAPHGGQRAIPGVPTRQGKGVRDFVTKTDAETARLTEELADAIAKISGKRPYVVIARFHRKFVDANRAPKLAYESDLAKPVYDAYQQALAETRQSIVDRWGGGILLDIHGQSLAPVTIYRGTQQGKSTAHLVERSGKEALTGEKSLFGQFAKQGFTVDPPVGSLARESHYSGGHIIATYGSAAGGTFDAIQIELGKNLRSATQRSQTVEKMAIAITAFAKDHLPKTTLK